MIYFGVNCPVTQISLFHHRRISLGRGSRECELCVCHLFTLQKKEMVKIFKQGNVALTILDKLFLNPLDEP